MTDSKIKHVTVSGLRLHLRRGEPEMLWVNGQNLLILNGTAAEFVEVFIDVMGKYPDNLEAEQFKQEIASRMQQRYPEAPDGSTNKGF